MSCKTPIEICLYKGQDNLMTLQAKSQGQPFSLNDYQARFQLRTSPGGEILCSLDSAEGGGITLTPAGEIQVVIPEAVVNAVTVPRIYHGLQLVEPSGKPRIVCYGPAMVVDGIVKSPYTRVP